jgi:hypothetical protein
MWPTVQLSWVRFGFQLKKGTDSEKETESEVTNTNAQDLHSSEQDTRGSESFSGKNKNT